MSAAPDPTPDAARELARRRARVWLVVAAAIALVHAVVRAALRLEMQPLSELANTLVSVSDAVVAASWLGAIATWAAAEGGRLARAAHIAAVVGFVLQSIVFDVAFVLAEPTEATRTIGVALSIGLNLVDVLVVVAFARGGRGAWVWAWVGLYGLARAGHFVVIPLVAPDLDAVTSASTVLGVTRVAALFALTLTLLLGPRRATLPAPRAESWARALAGARLVRHAEIARVLLSVGALVLGFLAVAARSSGLFLAAPIVALVGAHGAAIASLVGYARMSVIPLASDARGPAAAALTIGVVALAAQFGALGVTLAPVLDRDYLMLPGDAESAGLFASVLGAAAVVAFLHAIGRAGRRLGDEGVALGATITLVTYTATVTLLSLVRPGLLARASEGLRATLLLLGAAAAIGAVVALVATLRAFERALAQRDLLTRSSSFD